MIRKGKRIRSLLWPGYYGTVTRRRGTYVYVAWDVCHFTEDECHISTVVLA